VAKAPQGYRFRLMRVSALQMLQVDFTGSTHHLRQWLLAPAARRGNPKVKSSIKDACDRS
jgi:hypothetical protein